MIKKQLGFTLIELLIGITVLVTIIATVYASYSIGMKTYRKIEQESYLNQNMRQAWRIMSRDLRCAYISDSNTNIKFTGEHFQQGNTFGDKVTFVTYKPDVISNSGGISEVSYYVVNSSQTAYQGLVKEDRGFPFQIKLQSTTKTQVIAPLAKSLKLEYYDGESWANTWGIDASTGTNTQANSLPLAVKISITFTDKGGSERSESTIAPVLSN
jgi:prepilin-type N-terminal cleavage/methylation domain-containing protein